jgi:CheY-like chemotaxis protein
VSAGDNILIVEDEEEWSQVYKRAIEAVGENYTVKIAKDLTAAEDLIGTTKFAVAFVDVGLDVTDDRNVDGLSVMERIRATGDETSIIVVTGRSGQDLLPITRDAIQKYDAYYAVGKRTAEPAELRRLLQGGLEVYRKAVEAGSKDAQNALRGKSETVSWDDKVERHIGFKGNASEFYRFLNRLVRGYLPVLSKRDGATLDISSTAALVHGVLWSRAVGGAIVVCFGAAPQFDAAVADAEASRRLLATYDVEYPADRNLKGPGGVKGAVFLSPGYRRDDFG